MHELIELEEQGWRALSTQGDSGKKFYASILRENAVMLFPGGMRIAGRKRVLESLGAQPLATPKRIKASALSEQFSSKRYRPNEVNIVASRTRSEPILFHSCDVDEKFRIGWTDRLAHTRSPAALLLPGAAESKRSTLVRAARPAVDGIPSHIVRSRVPCDRRLSSQFTVTHAVSEL